MPRKGWTSISLKDELYRHIETLIQRYPSLGYATVVEFVRDAIRDKLSEIHQRLRIEPSEDMS